MNEKENLHKSIQAYIDLFSSKHDLYFDYWIASRVGSIGVFGDYFIDFQDIMYDLENDIPGDKFLKWYDLSLDLAFEEKPVINYSTYCKKC